MRSKMYRFWSHDNRFRLMLTLGLAVLLPAAALIYVNYHHLKSIERDKKIEAIIHRDFQYVLAASEKRLNQKAYTMTEEVKSQFPSPDNDTEAAKESKLDLILSKNPWVAHVFLYDRETVSSSVRNRSRWATRTFVKSMRTWRKVMVFGSAARKVRCWWTECTRRLAPFGTPVRQSGAGGDVYITTSFFVYHRSPRIAS